MVIKFSNAFAASADDPIAPSKTKFLADSTRLKKPRANGGHQRPKEPPALSNDLTRVRVGHWLSLLGGLSAPAFLADTLPARGSTETNE